MVYAKRLKKQHIDAERETVAECRGFYKSEHLVWQEASREAAALWKRCDEQIELLDRVRMSRHSVLVAEKERLLDQCGSSSSGGRSTRGAYVTPILRHGAPLTP